MFDRFFRRGDNTKADKAEKRIDMTDYNFYDNDDDDLTIVNPDGEEVGHVSAHSIEASDLAVTEAPAQEQDQKPAYFTGGYTTLSEGTSASNFRQVSSGEQVAYVNRVLGLSGDRYTSETTEAVKKYQQDNGLKVTGKVSPALYRSL